MDDVESVLYDGGIYVKGARVRIEDLMGEGH